MTTVHCLKILIWEQPAKNKRSAPAAALERSEILRKVEIDFDSENTAGFAMVGQFHSVK